MPRCEDNIVFSYDHPGDSAVPYCHPYLRENFRNVTQAGTHDEICTKNPPACNSCCYPVGRECTSIDHRKHIENFREIEQEKHLHCVAHCCPLGKVICCTDCTKNDCTNDRDIIKAEDISNTREGIVCHPVSNREADSYGIAATKERPCCAKNTSWTEARICRCDPYDPRGDLKRCGCECGAAIITETPKKKPKKSVRFADEVVKPEDCEKAFRSLDAEDAKYLCSCCKECAIIGKEQCIGKPVLVYELPEPKLEGPSVTQKDFCWQNIPVREVPPWHPNIKDRWRHMNVPSLCETTYQCDFKPPAVVTCAERAPVYLAPQREKIDPCQQLADEYLSWKKTSTGEKHTYHSTCNECDKDLHRVHLHECNVANLPPQYQCHGDGHVCQLPCHTTANEFAVSEKGDAGDLRYWSQRTSCVPDEKNRDKLMDCPPDLMKPVCPPYITSYKHDFKDPKRLQTDKLYFGNCRACEACTKPQYDVQPNLLCTANTGEPFITQRAAII